MVMKNKKLNSCEALQIIDNVPLEKDDWRLHLHNGDEIAVDTGNPEQPPTVIIQSIEYFALGTKNPAAKILTKDGEKIECLIREIF
jgi:hypothetical protein